MLRTILWVLTIARVALIPFFVFAGIEAQDLAREGQDFSQPRLVALGLIVLIGITDLLDGWMARRFDLTSQIGAVADAVADKLVQVALVGFLTLSVGPVFTALPLWFLVTVFGRDLVLLVGVSVLRIRYGPLRVVHRHHGRVASVLMFCVLAWSALGLPMWGLMPLMVGAAGVTVFSATVYALDGAAQGRAMSKP